MSPHSKSPLMKILLLLIYTLLGLEMMILFELKSGLAGILVGVAVVISTIATHEILWERKRE